MGSEMCIRDSHFGSGKSAFYPADLHLRVHQSVRRASQDGQMGFSGVVVRRGHRTDLLSDAATVLFVDSVVNRIGDGDSVDNRIYVALASPFLVPH